MKIKHIILFTIKIYQLTKRFRQPCCRFYPSCSNYAYQAIEKYGVGVGVVKSMQRLLKCNPFHLGGIDLVDKESRVI